MLTNFGYIRVGSLDEAVKCLGEKGARLHAGGTDLLGCLRDEVFEAETLVSISRLRGLQRIREAENGGLLIGALVSISRVAGDPLIQKRYPGLAQAASGVASPQLRNQGTIGGNLCQKPRCWYYRGEFHCLRKGGDTCFAFAGENMFHCILGGDRCYIVHPSDTAPALVALDAEVRIKGPNGGRTVPVETFHVPPSQDPQRDTVLEPGEIVTEVVLPPPPAGQVGSYRKVRARRSWDFALAGVALALSFEDDRVSRARIVLSGAAPVPWRSREAEKVITGKRIDAEVAARAARAAMEDARPLDQNGYKIPLFQGVIEEELLVAAGRAA
ncbi:MAG: xanthine dehydrogenase family protein subunit M [Deltaproteobacteria bacterium]|nr:xanthine dehydrogenase family protein subunit M [Deltaproteobacteria bacterium]